MTHGRICISVHATTIADLNEKIRTAVGKADLIEVRYDYLDPDELAADDPEKLRASMARVADALANTPSITTFRPQENGGHRAISHLERENFWRAGYETELADLEQDAVEWSLSRPWRERICSFHDFNGVPDDLGLTFQRLASTQVDIVKIAAQVDDAADAIPVWKLLQNSTVKVIPIAMGEAGKWTRILGLAHGAPITYASLDSTNAIAPGQISAAELDNVYRVKQLDRETKIFGIVAGDTTYSQSPYMHNAAFKAAGLNSVFVPFQVRDLDAFVRRMVRPDSREVDLDFGGLSVTNPHKQAIIEHLDEIDPTARSIGAVNTVKVDGRKLIGFNTDAAGFLAPLEDKLGDFAGARAAVVGAGGAARACIFALKNAGAEVTLYARNAEKARALVDEFDIAFARLPGVDGKRIQTDILVNATPLGTRGPNEGETVATADEIRGVRLVYDLVYNPTETRLLREATIAGCDTLGGLDMLVAQGVKQFEIWTGRDAPLAQMRSAILERLQ